LCRLAFPSLLDFVAPTILASHARVDQARQVVAPQFWKVSEYLIGSRNVGGPTFRLDNQGRVKGPLGNEASVAEESGWRLDSDQAGGSNRLRKNSVLVSF
jgi:hypothetical protein